MSDIIDFSDDTYNIDLIERALLRTERNMISGFNSIPWNHLPRLNKYVTGIEPYALYIITASSGVGKSQITDNLFLYHPYKFWKENQEQGFDYRIQYYSMEMSPEIKCLQIFSHFLFNVHQVRVPVKELMSISKKLNSDVYELMKKERPLIENFLDKVRIIGGQQHPYTIYNQLRSMAAQFGTIHQKKVMSNRYDATLGRDVPEEREIFSHYDLHNPKMYLIGIVDHASLILPGKEDKRVAMEKYSQYLMTLRNMFGMSLTSIQQQSSDQEGKENYKRPTLSGLGDNKAVQRDAEYILGLYDPYRNKDWNSNGHKIQELNQFYREIIVLKSRFGIANISDDLFFDGAIGNFYEMPDPKDQKYQAWIDYAKQLHTQSYG